MKRLLIPVLSIVFISNLICLRLSFGLDVITSTTSDLNGDGNVERISIAIPEDSYGDFILNVDGVSVQAKLFAGKADGFLIVDIDTIDKHKEIAVHTPGPSCDDEYLIFGYYEESIKEMGKLSRWPKFFGNGTVIVEDWMGFWAKREKYLLNQRARSLELVPQELYYVGIETVVAQGFPIYKARGDSTIVAHLEPQSKANVLLCDPLPSDCEEESLEAIDWFYCDWYLIKSEEGIVGWARLKSFWDKLDLNWAD